MTHTIRERQKLLTRIRRVRGQVEALERAVDEERGCETVMHLIAGVRGSMASLMADVLEDHVRAHFVAREEDAPGAPPATEALIQIMHTYLK